MNVIWILLALGGVGQNTVTVIERFPQQAHCEAAAAALNLPYVLARCVRVENPAAPAKTSLKVIA